MLWQTLSIAQPIHMKKQLDRTAMSDQKVVSNKLQNKFELFDKPKSDNKVNEGQ